MVDESYPPGEGWQGGAHLTIRFTGDLLTSAEMLGARGQSPGLQAGDLGYITVWALVFLPIQKMHWSPSTQLTSCEDYTNS